jgi:two-component system response regulator YesN
MTTEDSARLINGKLTKLFRNMSLDWLYAPRSPLFIFQMFSRLPLSDQQTDYLGGRITGELSSHLGSFHIIIGRQVRDYHNLYESYASAVISLQTAFFLPVNTYLSSSSSSEKNTFRPLDEVNYENNLKNLLTGRDTEGLRNYTGELLSALTGEKERILPNQVKDLYYRLHLMLWSTARSMQLDPQEAINSSVIWNDINSCNTIYELDRLLAGNISSVIKAMETPSGESEAVYNIKNFIARTYSDPGLSIKDISVYAHLSTSYMCTMFKNETGRTLNQYITEFRMARAKDLLDDPRNKIVEVAGQVGYNDSNYFSKTFRKAFGMSPSEYREQSAPGGAS